ncbi:hypothetical protein [Streptomyces sp. NPDC046805]|uniref:hypothetical protein n=1 Tax=Streptomyces sp. NPDC046805 TaxID=3155134 RepID=UPI0033DC7C39
MRYVFIKFPNSREATYVGVRMDEAATDLAQTDFAGGTGSVHIERMLILNTVRARCVADVELSSLSGTGHLAVLEESAVR